MIDFYYWPTPNGWKVSIMLEETGLPYTLKPVNIGAGDQFTPAFMSISPNARMPAIVDHDAPDGPLPVFESGAILIHLAEKSGRFMPTTAKGRKECLEWLFWQVGNPPAEVVRQVLRGDAVEAAQPFLQPAVVGVDVVEMIVRRLAGWLARLRQDVRGDPGAFGKGDYRRAAVAAKLVVRRDHAAQGRGDRRTVQFR